MPEPWGGFSEAQFYGVGPIVHACMCLQMAVLAAFVTHTIAYLIFIVVVCTVPLIGKILPKMKLGKRPRPSDSQCFPTIGLL